MERKTAEPLPIRAPRPPGLPFCFAVAGVLTLLIPGLAGACTEPVGIQDCIQGGGRVGYSAAVRGPACQGGTADACPVRMGPGGPAPAGVYLANPPRLCVKNLKMASLNLQGVQNDVDNWIRKKINDSLIVHDICSS